MRLHIAVRVYQGDHLIASRDYSNEDHALRDGMRLTQQLAKCSPVLNTTHTLIIENLERKREICAWNYDHNSWSVRISWKPGTLFLKF
jgi:hypothetical protein